MNAFETILDLQGYPLREAEKELSHIIALSPADFAIWQENKRWEIVNYHLKHNSFYKSLAQNNKSLTWDDLPIMTKAHYQRPLGELISKPYRDGRRLYVSNTSGSSGHPFYFAKDKYGHAMTWAFVKYRYGQIGLKLSDKQGRFYGIPLERKGLWIENIKDMVMNRIRFPVFDLSDERLEIIKRKIIKSKVKYLYGYTSALVHFARFLQRTGCHLNENCSDLSKCIVTSEVCTPEDRLIMSSAFGVDVVVEYGASELGIMAFESGTGMIGSDELIYFETNETPDGDHELLCTSLFNKAFPIIRYKIGDIVELEARNGRTLFKKLLGRTNDLIRLPSGKTAAGLTFYYVSRSILETSGVLKEFIIRQTAIDTFEFEIVSDRLLSPDEERLISDKASLYLEEGLKIRFLYVQTISRPGSGKIKHFYSAIDD